MSTRSLTILHDNGGVEIAVLYRHYDGYPSCHGRELADFLKGFSAITNGIADSREMGKVANGGNCLAAQIISYFKKEVGNFYLYPVGKRDIGEEYTYHVYPGVGREIRLKILKNTFVLFDGPVSEFDAEAVSD